jgi:NlpC/P60 family protein
MSRPTLFALLLCAALSLGPAPKAFAAQAQTQAGRQTQGTGPQTHAPGQQALPARHPAIPPGLRPLDLREGRAIVQEMAWADDEEGLSPDCSHLVHRLYQQAGYPYPYASSLDLYRGTGQFLRVRYAQPGDLIVWRGHVGIVVNPKEHSFFSSVTSGTRIENYRSAYWRARGYPRFFRYLTSSPLKSTDKTLEAANRPMEPQLRADPQLKGQADHPSASNRQGDRVTHRQRDTVSDPPSLQAVKTTPAAAKPSKPSGEVEPTSAARTDNAQQIPLRTGGHPPKAADVASALDAANLDAGEILRAGNLERLERPVVVYRNLQVSGVELKGKRGTAQIQIETLATISRERMESLLGREEHQLELQRIKKGWAMTPANQTVYVPRDGAMRILSERLALLAQSAERSTEKDREQANIIRFLNLMIE